MGKQFSLSLAPNGMLNKQVEYNCRTFYLVSRIIHPEPSDGSLIRILWQQWILWPCFINVFKYDKGLSYWFAAVNEDRYLLVNWVVLQQQFTLIIRKIFFYVLIPNTFQFQSPYNSLTKRAGPEPMQLHFCHCCYQMQGPRQGRVNLW